MENVSDSGLILSAQVSIHPSSEATAQSSRTTSEGASRSKMSNSFCLCVEKTMKRWMTLVGAEEKLLCVVCKVQTPSSAPSIHGDDNNYVVERVHDSITRRGYACIALRDFYKLEMMHGVKWNEMHRVIFRHKKKNAYALLYSGELGSAAESAMKSHFETKISELVDINYHSISGNNDMKILSIKGSKTNGRHVYCDFVDVHHAESILNSYKMPHGAGGNTARVGPLSE